MMAFAKLLLLLFVSTTAAKTSNGMLAKFKQTIDHDGLATSKMQSTENEDKVLEEEADDQDVENGVDGDGSASGGSASFRRRRTSGPTTTTPAPLPPTKDVIITEIGDPADGTIGSRLARFVELYSKTGGPLEGLYFQKSTLTSTKTCALSGRRVPEIPKDGYLILCDSQYAYEKFFPNRKCDIVCAINMDGGAAFAVTDGKKGPVIDAYGVRGISAYGTAQDFKDGRAERNSCVGARLSWRVGDWTITSPGSGTDTVNTDGFNPGFWKGADPSACEKTCSDDRYLLKESNQCLEACPPGYFNAPGPFPNYDPGQGGKCKKCLGTISNRRRATAEQCKPCPDGELSKEDSDGCMNAQGMCDPAACNACEDCLITVAPEMTQCADTQAAGCFDPGRHWCGAALTKLTDCQGESLACWYKLLCQSECVCGVWKGTFCGGDVGNEPCPSALLQMAKMANSTLQTASTPSSEASPKGLNAYAEDASLEQSLTGKRSC